jgi:hypothetical protein
MSKKSYSLIALSFVVIANFNENPEAVGAAAGPRMPNRPQASERATLQTVRKLVARNEALINPIKLEYTVNIRRTGERQIPAATGGRRRGRAYSHFNYVWAQDGEKHYARTDSFYGPNELARSTVYVFDDQIITMGKLPELMEGTISAVDTRDWYNVMVAKLGLRPFEGEHRLSEILLPEYASLHDEFEILNGRETYVIDTRRPSYHHTSFARIWIDKQRGMPLRIWFFRKHPAWGDEESISQINDIELYQLPNGAWIPVQGVRSINFSDSYTSYEHISVDVNSIKIQREDIPESLFKIDFPAGARIYNAITGLTTVKGQPFKTYEQIVEAGGSFIAGIVADANGNPVPEVVAAPGLVTTQQSDGRSRSRIIQPHERTCAITDSKGRFALGLEQEGLYELWFYPKDFVDTRIRSVPLGEHNLKVTLNKGGILKGRVVRIVKGQKVPVANIDVTMQDQGVPRASLKSGRPRRTTTDSQGFFQIRYLSTQLPPRRSGNQQQYRPRPWELRCGSVTKTILFEKGINNQDVELILKPLLSTAAPLTGRALPSFNDIKINLDSSQTKGRIILVCFFDMEQRPARNCIIQLNKQAQQLSQQGVTVVAVQASKVDENALNKWVKKYKIPLPVGIVQGDEEDIRFTWGVRSLPWLILTDKQHAVTAEGFTLTELNEKLSSNSKN